MGRIGRFTLIFATISLTGFEPPVCRAVAGLCADVDSRVPASDQEDGGTRPGLRDEGVEAEVASAAGVAGCQGDGNQVAVDTTAASLDAAGRSTFANRAGDGTTSRRCGRHPSHPGHTAAVAKWT